MRQLGYGIFVFLLASCGIVPKLQVQMSMEQWDYPIVVQDKLDLSLQTDFTIQSATNSFNYYGQSWTLWPSTSFSDGGYDIGILLRGTDSAGYRVQYSSTYQDIALIKYPEGGYLQSVPFTGDPKQMHSLEARIEGNRITAKIDGVTLINFVDSLDPILTPGNFAIGIGQGAKVKLDAMAWNELDPSTELHTADSHVPNFSVRQWLGFRPWIFDGNEPVLMLPVPASTYINSVKLTPGYKPQLSFNSSWGIDNQGAFPEGSTTQTFPAVSGGGNSLTTRWTATQKQGIFSVDTAMTVTFNSQRQAYDYDIDSTLRVIETFYFKYGFDFEHHAPIYPFFWQHMVAKGFDDVMVEKAMSLGPSAWVFPHLKQDQGVRFWYKNALGPVRVNPAVEFAVTPDMIPIARNLKMAICEAFFDTGAFFPTETALAGTEVHVRYRYTGYPPALAEELFALTQN